MFSIILLRKELLGRGKQQKLRTTGSPNTPSSFSSVATKRSEGSTTDRPWREEVRSAGRAQEGLTCVGPQVDGELAGVAAGVGADLALEGPLVGVDAQVLVQAAAVGGGVGARLALVGLHARVAPHVRLQLVLAAEALAADFTLVGFVSFSHTTRAHQEAVAQEGKRLSCPCLLKRGLHDHRRHASGSPRAGRVTAKS